MNQTSSNRHADKRDRRREPLKVELNVVVKTGDDPEDRVTIVDDREVPMVGSVFEYRDRIMRFSVGMIWRVVATSPAVYREVVPGMFHYLNTLRRGRER